MSAAVVIPLPIVSVTRGDRILAAARDAYPATEFHLTHGQDLCLTWTDGPTAAHVEAVVPAGGRPVQMQRHYGPAGTAMTLQVMQSLMPWTRLTRFGRPVRDRALHLEDSLTYRDVLALPEAPQSVGEVMDAIFHRLDLS